MSAYSSVDASHSPPRVTLPRDYNAAVDFIDRNVAEGRGARIALHDDAGSYSYADLLERVNRAGNALLGLGLPPESRVAMAMLDTVDFPAVFWGAIKAGLVPIPLNTLLTVPDYAYMLRDSRARALVVSDLLLEKLAPAAQDQPYLKHVVVSGAAIGRASCRERVCLVV